MCKKQNQKKERKSGRKCGDELPFRISISATLRSASPSLPCHPPHTIHHLVSRSALHMHRSLLPEGPVACPLAHARPFVQHAATAAARNALVTFGLDDARRVRRNSGT